MHAWGGAWADRLAIQKMLKHYVAGNEGKRSSLATCGTPPAPCIPNKLPQLLSPALPKRRMIHRGMQHKDGLDAEQRMTKQRITSTIPLFQQAVRFPREDSQSPAREVNHSDPGSTLDVGVLSPALQ